MEKERLHELFRFSGILPHYQGYEYLEEAVLMAVENPMRLQNIQEGIYLPIASCQPKQCREGPADCS